MSNALFIYASIVADSPYCLLQQLLLPTDGKVGQKQSEFRNEMECYNWLVEILRIKVLVVLVFSFTAQLIIDF